MPRLTTADYLETRNWLKKLWDDGFVGRGWFAYLSFAEQWYLHDYFQVSKDLANDQLAVHRDDITAKCPSLPQQAGKAASHLDRIIIYGPTQDPAYQREQRRAQAYAQKHANKHGRRKVRAITVRAVVRPEPDYKKFAKLVFAMALKEAEKEHKQ